MMTALERLMATTAQGIEKQEVAAITSTVILMVPSMVDTVLMTLAKMTIMLHGSLDGDNPYRKGGTR